MSPIGEWEPAEPGVKRKIFEPGQALMMMEVHFEEGAEGYVHSHPHEQMSYCLKGTIEFTIDGQKTVIRAGDTIIIPGGAKHGVKALEPSALLDAFTPLRDDLLKRG
ncbi:cupin domain-containing protein [Paenibacillus oceani]|jgi:quercetin dioxygenase-like cupin family protein|uniref:Cupin domain-containing protein n=1 Tax=Paenibacillus oceani TaxID=2772510 RepID=A0A927CDN9_9BACL|nr:cupin domain-containing protein [Paenibacillus oceani]MBD2866159.1 cupin domain-containing protein [Paenibacillus oceani]